MPPGRKNSTLNQLLPSKGPWTLIFKVRGLRWVDHFGFSKIHAKIHFGFSKIRAKNYKKKFFFAQFDASSVGLDVIRKRAAEERLISRASQKRIH
jgi:hypothetical protein